MENRSMRRKPVMPRGQSRREVLAFAAAVPLAHLLGTEASATVWETPRIIVRDGWILRADDLNRLALA